MPKREVRRPSFEDRGCALSAKPVRAAACLLCLVGVVSVSLVRAQPAPEPPPGTNVEPVPPAVVPQVVEEEQQALALLADLQRYSSESAEELRRDLAAANQAVARARTDANRVRLAVLLTMPATGAPDDARALALLDQVVGKTPAVTPVKQIAAILYAQVNERARGVTEERRKTAAAQEKLDQLRAVERSLLLERSRNAGGAGGGGGGGTGR